ncbi:MAG: hypothetical protein HY059_09745 [Proteobacteria bacterium]|nr:hypothetical protein [Pseudomonadota bacterium]
MNPDDLSKELDRLWAKVAPNVPTFEDSSLIPPRSLGVDPGTPVREASLEAIHLLKRQHREQASEWQRMLDAKDEALRALHDRLRRAEGELVELRKSASSAEHRIMSEMYDVASKLEASHEAIKSQEQGFRREETILRELLDKTRQQLAAETNRWRDLERQWNEREQGYLDDLHEMQDRLGKAQQGAETAQASSRQQSDSMKEAKRAVEATLAELIAERRLREESNQDRERAMQRVAELTDRLSGIQKTWDEERRQWQELWDRERSTWEVQRQEFAGWEERLRREREAWHEDLKQKESEVLRFSSAMSETLRQSAETGSKLSQVLRAAAASASGIQGPYVPKRWRPAIAAGTGALLLFIGSYAGYRRYMKPSFQLLHSHVLAAGNPTATAYDGSALWIAEWSGRMTAVDPANPSTVVARYDVTLTTPFHPISIAFGGGNLYSIDAAQSRILRHTPTDPRRVQGNWPAPGPAPVAAAHDGKYLWTYDAVNKTLYRHLGEGAGAQVDAFRPGIDMVPDSMAWLGDELWIHDSKGKRIVRLRLADKEKDVRLIDALAFDTAAQAISAYRVTDGVSIKRILWAVSGSMPAPAPSTFSLKEYAVRP